MPGEKAPTIYDVARLADVSHQTVSRVVKGHTTVTPQMRERVEAAVELLGYRPNLIARSLATRKAYRIGALVYGLSAAGPNAIIDAAAARVEEAGFLLDIISVRSNDARGVARAIETVSLAELAGVVAVPSTFEIASAISDRKLPIPIVVGRIETTETVDPDFAGIDASIEHLALLGHRRFLYVAGAPGWIASESRTRHYLASVAQRGLVSVAVVHGDWSARSGYEVARSVSLESRPTAVVAANDQTAVGVVAGLRTRGIEVPEDMSVVGFDDLAESQFLRPSLTTVRADFAGYGRTAVEKLLRVLDPDATWLPTQEALGALIVRESTAPPTGKDGRLLR